MGLVDYSDSESDSDSPKASALAKNAAPPAKTPFQKLVDKSNPHKIFVNLPSASATEDAAPSEAPAAKRLKTGGSRFSGFGSFLPPPKAALSKPSLQQAGSSGKAVPKVGVNLKTSSEAAFSRDSPTLVSTENDEDDTTKVKDIGGSGLKLPPLKASAQPSILDGQKPAEEVKLVGKPLMFKPLSVARKPGRKNGVKAATTVGALGQVTTTASAAPREEPIATAPPKKKVSLFSIANDTQSVEAAPEESPFYEPQSTTYDDSAFTNDTPSYEVQQQGQGYANYTQPPLATDQSPNSLNSIADDLNLDPAARRELFGRGGSSNNKATAKSVINFNLDQEYRHNEELRASGALEQQQHNPLRALKSGKHSLQQLVNQVQTQRDALEENFAKNRATQKQSGARYGWR